MKFTSQRRLDCDVLEREFALGDIHGCLWTPSSSPSPLILLGHPGGLGKMYPRLVGRAQRSAADGFAAATIELPEQPRSDAADSVRAELRRAIQAGQRPSDEIVERLVFPLVEHAVPAWQRTLDALLALPEVSGPVGFAGGFMSVGIRLATVEPRIAALGLFAGSWVPEAMVDEARRLTLPLHMLLQWDDEGNDRQMALDLFDAFGSKDKTLHANMGGHTGVPSYAGEDAAGFFRRHLKPAG